MSKSAVSVSDIGKQAQSKDNSRCNYVMLKEKRILGRWREKDEIILLTPSQAEYHLRNKTLELKKESK